MGRKLYSTGILVILLLVFNIHVFAQRDPSVTFGQDFMINVEGHRHELLNGKWDVIIDVFGQGRNNQFFKDAHPKSKTERIEYAFDGALRLDVPGDWNSQLPELKYYEGNIWYRRLFNVEKKTGRSFIYFSGVNYKSSVWLNGKELGQHEGGFTPFQFEVTDDLREGLNTLIVLVNNDRVVDGIPAMNFDWWNYGGITRDVYLVNTPDNYINDYFIQLKKNTTDKISGYVQMKGSFPEQNVTLEIPDLKLKKEIQTSAGGKGYFEWNAKPQLWSPENPKLYEVRITSGEETVTEKIGFRSIHVSGTDILLNGKPVFLKGINCHEEIPQRAGRAYSEADANMLLGEVKALGCNFLRLTHYPQNEHMVRTAESLGIMMWEEIPIWQGIQFGNEAIIAKADKMLREMIYRDKNRAGICIWSIANETRPGKDRDRVLTGLSALVRELDPTRLVSAAFDNVRYDKASSTFSLNDSLTKYLDVVSVNKYLGWYQNFEADPSKVVWNVATDKPLLFSEFGGEALYGKHDSDNPPVVWSEENQGKIYKDNVLMFRNIVNLRGTTPWVLFDFRSPNRFHPVNQEGWNRKGLLSDKGMRKKSWYVIRDYYKSIKSN